MISTPSRRGVRVLAVTLGVGVLAATAAVALPAAAAEPTPTATMSLSVTSGTPIMLDSPTPGKEVMITTSLACGPVEGGSRDIFAFVSEPGKEIPTSADGKAISAYDYAYTRNGLGGFDADLGALVPPFALVQSISQPLNDFVTVPLSAALGKNTTMSVGLVCTTGQDQPTILLDANGKPKLAWVSITTDAAGKWSVNVPKTATTTTLTGAQEGANGAKLTATVAPAEASGTVDYFEGGSKVGSAPVSAGVATTVVPNLVDGAHSFTANYVPVTGANFAASTSSAASVTISKVRVATTVELAGSAVGYDGVSLAATVRAAGATATAAAGTVEFWSAGAKKGEAPVVNGAASFAVTALADGASYAFTAKFVPAATEANLAASAESAAATVALPALPTLLKAGDKVEAGKTYRAELKAGTFAAGATVKGEIHTDAIVLTETATAAADGAARFIFVVPTSLAAGSSHELVLSDGTKTARVPFSIVAAGEKPTDGGANPTTTPTVPNTGTNVAASFATDWVATAGNNPAGVIGVIASLLALAAASVAGLLVWRRRSHS